MVHIFSTLTGPAAGCSPGHVFWVYPGPS